MKEVGRGREKIESGERGGCGLSLKTPQPLKVQQSGTHVGRLFVVVDVVDVSGQAEVGNLHDVALSDQDIPGGQVSVYTLGWRKKQEDSSYLQLIGKAAADK